VQVEVKQRLRGRILVSGNLSDGEILILEGIQGLRDGQVLNIQNASDVGLPQMGARGKPEQEEGAS
jgi:hypothetical protein